MKHNIFLYAVVLLACLSCSTKQKVTVEYKDYRPLNMSSFVTLQKNILLDTPTEESRIQDFHIGRLLFAQERIYVIDEKENKILMFNDEGKFLKSIGGATGEVSGNRLKIQDAALDAQPQKLYAYCSTTCQIMVFDLDLNVEQTIPMVTPLLEIGLDGNCLYAIRTSLKRDGCELVVFERTGWRTRLPSCGNKQVSPPGNKLPEKHSSCPKNRFHRLKTAPMQACRKATGFAKYGTGKSRQPTTWILAEKPLNPLPITSTTSVLRTPS